MLFLECFVLIKRFFALKLTCTKKKNLLLSLIRLERQLRYKIVAVPKV